MDARLMKARQLTAASRHSGQRYDDIVFATGDAIDSQLTFPRSPWPGTPPACQNQRK
jgi:hypothetical protein